MLPEERAAAEFVGKVTSASVDLRSSGRHDADLTLPSGRRIGLEVTQAADADEVQTWAAINQRRVEGSPLLSRWWSAGLRPGANVQTAHAVLPAQLARLEQAGVTEFRWLDTPHSVPSNEPAFRAAKEVLERAGVEYLHSVDANEGGLSFVVQKPGGPIAGQDVVDAVEAEAWKPDNRSKLAAMPTEEHHLFVWIDLSRPEAHGVLRLGVLPIPDPRLPPELTTLWVAARVSDEQRDWRPAAARRLDPPGPWVSV